MVCVVRIPMINRQLGSFSRTLTSVGRTSSSSSMFIADSHRIAFPSF
ncbi:hypothetical protein IG631_21262 [Alternaria alternata]|nr:hypothetical protein IG631_21262 [Alternaria alternata]